MIVEIINIAVITIAKAIINGLIDTFTITLQIKIFYCKCCSIFV